LPKTFFLEPGLFARCDGLWYEPGILLVVEPGDRVEIFAARDGSPGMRKAQYDYRQLDAKEPPLGLRGDWRGRLRLSLSRAKSSLTSPIARRARHTWPGARVAA
jgi:hypothetical protein